MLHRFPTRHHNRRVLPTRHVLVCEDILAQQARVAAHLSTILEHEGAVEVSLVSGALAAWSVLCSRGADVVILDRDMPHGNGDDLLLAMGGDPGLRRVPVITFSGIPGNNSAMRALGESVGLRVHEFDKESVIGGAADELIRSIVGT